MFKKIFLFVTILWGLFAVVLAWVFFYGEKPPDAWDLIRAKALSPLFLFFVMLYVWWMWDDA